ncbi:hypothetical protein RAS1_25460 [Phycisphaerae bacterium RAS1]|nr:hypothetical protein RAS1_25460 [Phycisphaerae bacterium RAS1]
MKPLFCLLLLAAVLSANGPAQSNIDAANAFAWAENIGWTNWRHERPAAGDGVLARQRILSGFVWSENTGWLNLGDGAPADGVQYANVDSYDFGVNLDPDTRELFGLAWGENVGWVNFAGGGLAAPPQPARLAEMSAGGGCRFRGFAWAENVGWLNLDDAGRFVALATSVLLADMNCDCTVDILDINPFVLALSDPAAFAAAYPGCSILNGDLNADDSVDVLDINPFIGRLSGF